MQKFSVVGIVLLTALFWLFSQNATGKARQTYNLLLVVLFVSVLLATDKHGISNWSKVSKIIYTKG
jgi:nucleoside permease NupC